MDDYVVSINVSQLKRRAIYGLWKIFNVFAGVVTISHFSHVIGVVACEFRLEYAKRGLLGTCVDLLYSGTAIYGYYYFMRNIRHSVRTCTDANGRALIKRAMVGLNLPSKPREPTPQLFTDQRSKLQTMGFNDDQLNLRLLIELQGDMGKVITRLAEY
jgi:hypothetical protein